MSSDQREFKALPFTNLKAQSTGRERAGIASVFGNVDEINDRVMPGAFLRTISGGAKRSRFLWNHSYQHPPIATITELKELTRDELPEEVLTKAPEATGGLLVRRKYFDNVELADWILQAIDAGEINEMSFAFEIVRSQDVTEPIDGDPDKSQTIRNIEEVKLYDCSDVLWGCNAATVATGAKSYGILPLGAIASQLMVLEAEIKAGRRNSDSDQKLVDMIHGTAVKLGAICVPEDDDATQTDTGKSEPADNLSTSLSPNWLELQKAKTRVLALQNSLN